MMVNEAGAGAIGGGDPSAIPGSETTADEALGGTARLAELANEIRESEARVEEQAALLKDEKERHRRLIEEEIPSAMDAAGTLEVKALGEGGETVRLFLKDVTRCSVPLANRSAAILWLDNNGHAEIVKRTLVANLGTDSADRQELLTQGILIRQAIEDRFTEDDDDTVRNEGVRSATRDILAELGATPEECDAAAAQIFDEAYNPDVDLKVDTKVEPSTLTKLCRQELAAGRSLPEDIFSTYTARQAKIEVKEPDAVL